MRSGFGSRDSGAAVELLESAGGDVDDESVDDGAEVDGGVLEEPGEALGDVLESLGEALGDVLGAVLGAVESLGCGVVAPPLGGGSVVVCAYARAMVPTSAAAAPIAARGFNIVISDSFGSGPSRAPGHD
ncbi:MAG: hypothetical protein HZC37_03965 [Burkholderiales bacterium]|nr:hypothetical protein [Burkholderiales bacterium]